ncbi:AraC family transcriptional regulator [Pseudoduganella lutea]|uniref:Helix-turn-helix domain-containing protein n=1 Tax=Pseudoduganella lutea TaxID=321985 RepID=A0A4P6KTC9_9BURK|nr:substrate-binding domain-containing protein [Pseudoduganella lutea]QBE61914.1 helix-turn-helix domain-containing protein [Pseudoduganella lutea]
MEPTKRSRIALLLGENEVSNSKMITGIVEHMRQHLLNWNLLLTSAPADGESLAPLARHADAFIVNSDVHDVESLRAGGATVIGVALGRSALPVEHRAPTVFADNVALVRKAYDYLISHGAARFAVLSAPAAEGRCWVREREEEFIALARRDRADVSVFQGEQGSQPVFGVAMTRLIGWLDGLPKPVAIFAADEIRARLLTQACALAGYDAGSQVLIVGIDSDPLAQDLSPVPLASVMLDRQEMGRRAAQMLHRALERRLQVQEEWVAPLELAQAPHKTGAPSYHPQVMRALHFIRLNARRGIKAEQVAYYVRMSRSALEARFKRELGRSVHDEILRFKLEEAKQMLRSGAASMPEVAVNCGFTSVQYLYTVFGRELGCTPRVWQDRILKQGALAAA